MARKSDQDFPKLHPHMLRHSYGVILYRNNMSKAEIAKLLGHEQEATTEIYVETDVDMINKAFLSIYGLTFLSAYVATVGNHRYEHSR